MQSIRPITGYLSLSILLSVAAIGCTSTERPGASPESGAQGPLFEPTPDIDVGTQLVDQPDNQPEWAVPYGAEFWNRPPQSAGSERALNLHRIIQRVESAFSRGTEETLEVNQTAHRTSLQGPHLVFEPKLPMHNGAKGARAEIRTAQVRCGQSPVGIRHRSDWLVTGNTSQRQLAPKFGVVEHVTVDPSAAEMTWTFGSTALTDCDRLTVFAHVAGLKFAETTSEGLHFRDREGRPRMRMSHATIVDSAGDRWDRNVEHVGEGLVRISLDEGLIADASAPLAIDPKLQSEKAVDMPVDTGTQTFADEVRSASNGNNTLLAWGDDDVPDEFGATRVSSSGTVLDPSGLGFRAKYNAAQYKQPAVISDGTDYLLAWADDRGIDDSIYATRIDAGTGNLLDGKNGKKLATNGYAPTLAYNGTNYLLAWRDERRSSSNSDIYGVRLDATANRLSSADITIGVAPDEQEQPKAASNGTDFLVAWKDERDDSSGDVYMARVLADGSTPDYPKGTVLSNAANKPEVTPDLASDGTKYLAVWRSGESDSFDPENQDIEAATIDVTSGNITASSPTPVTSNSSDHRTPAVTFGSTNYFVVWNDTRNGTSDEESSIYGARIDTSGNVIDSPGIAITDTSYGNELEPSVTFNGTDFLTSWYEGREPRAYRGIYAARVSTSATVKDPNGLLLNPQTNRQRNIELAYDGTRYFAVWNDNRDPGTGLSILGLRIGTDGTPIDASAIQISEHLNPNLNPRIESNGDNFLVAWTRAKDEVSNSGKLHFRRVDGASGNLLGSDSQQLSKDFAEVALGSDGSDYLIAWADYTADDGDPELLVQRLTGGGTLLDQEVMDKSRGSGFGYENLTMAYNGTDYLVVWQRGGIKGKRVRPSDGEVIDDSPLFDFGIGYAPVVVSDGRDYILGWIDGIPKRVYAQKLTAFGTLVGSKKQLMAGEVAGRGRDYLDVAYDGRVCTFVWETPASIRGARLDFASMEVIDKPLQRGSFLVNSGEGPTIATHGKSQFLVGYHRETPSSGKLRAYTRRLTLNDDSDALLNHEDNCPQTTNPSQSDRDGDSVGDACDPCPDISRPTCSIGGMNCLVAGDKNPQNGCQECQPSESKTTWTIDGSNSCDDGNACTEDDSCNASGECSGSPVGEGMPCSDDNPCTTVDRCDGTGHCSGSDPKDCSNLDNECQVGVCEESAGGCTTEPRADGTPCGEARSCSDGTVTLRDTCQSGTCEDEGTLICFPFKGCADDTSCMKNCSDDSDCVEDAYCHEAESTCRHNEPPTAKAGEDLEALEGTQVVLDGGNSMDPDSDSLEFTWTQLSGPSVQLQNQPGARATFTAPTIAEQVDLTFRLEVEAEGAADTDTTTITVLPIGESPGSGCAAGASDSPLKGTLLWLLLGAFPLFLRRMTSSGRSQGQSTTEKR